jgi:hypothetical protein
VTARFHLARAEALPDPDHPDGRLCAYCGDVIDPIYYCTECAGPERACTTHPRPRKRADAAFCNDVCRAKYRSTFASDCLPFLDSRR